MKQRNYTTSFTVNNSPEEVFTAVTRVRDWWSRDISGSSGKQGDEFVFEVPGVHRSVHKLVEVVPNKKVVWLITEANMTFIKKADEWTGTKVVFDITEENDKTKLTFTHVGLVPEVECYKFCTPAWEEYIAGSLYKLITTGKGSPTSKVRLLKSLQKLTNPMDDKKREKHHTYKEKNTMYHQTIEQFSIIGIAVRTTNEQGKSEQDIPALWDRFMAEGILQEIPDKIDEAVYCIYTNYEKDHTKPYTTIIGCRVSGLENIPEGMVGKKIETGNYAKYVAKGNVMQGVVQEVWKKIWKSAIQRAYLADFDVYGEKAQNLENAEVEIYVGLK